jgi:uncharacterized membrane protein YraQ (UPF0718 family)
MQAYFSFAVYIITFILLMISFCKSKAKTVLALKKAWKMFWAILPQFVSILLTMGIILALVEPNTIKAVIGSDSGIWGGIGAAIVGAIVLVPVLIAFPIASELLAHGAGLAQIAVFISTLTTVGIVTIPLEIKFLGKKVAILRNVLFFIAAFLVALIVKLVLT